MSALKKTLKREYTYSNMNAFLRTELLVGSSALQKLKNSHVAVFGVGGVGGFAVEGLVRSGVGEITVFDNDTVSESNLNRQIIATVDTVGKDKVTVVKNRVLSINPDVKVNAEKVFFMPENADDYDFTDYDYIIDAVDTVTAKLAIIERAKKFGVPVISSMGTGGKLDATRLQVADISKTEYCPLAKVMRRELKKRGIDKLKVVFSPEITERAETDEKKADGKTAPPSMIFVPATAGLILAGEVVKDLIKE